jgi:hypothetical protein
MKPSVVKNGTNVLTGLREVLAEAATFADQFEERYRTAAFDRAADYLLAERRSDRAFTDSLPTEVRVGTSATAALKASDDPMTRLAAALQVAPQFVARAIELSGGGKIRILGRIDGSSVRELQVRYTLVYCYVREKGFGEQQTGIEELRELCISQSCYDQANFTAYFRRAEDLIREVGARGTREKRYLASRRGLEEGERLLRILVES